MLRFPTLRTVSYLIVMLCTLFIPLSDPFATLVSLTVVLLLCATEYFLFAKHDGGEPIFRVVPKKNTKRLLFLYAPFELFSLLAAIITAFVLSFFDIPMPEYPHSLDFFIAAVVLAPLAEELLFRGLLFRVLSPLGANRCICLTALVFAFMHGSLYQIPYAFLAGLFLGYLREKSGALLYPVLFHVTSNLLSFFALNGILLLGIWLILSVAATYLLAERYPISLPQRAGERPTLASLIPIFAFCAVMVFFAVASEVV